MPALLDVGTLWTQLLTQFYADSFQTSLVFWSWSENMRVVWILSSGFFVTFFAS